MMAASSKGGGECFASPDVCLTPSPIGPVPIPYPNTSQVASSTNVSTKVKFAGTPALHKMSEQPTSSGDEAGTAGGVVSGVNMNKVTYRQGSSKVKIEGQQAVYHTAMTAHNGVNANMPAGMQVSPSQDKVFVAF